MNKCFITKLPSSVDNNTLPVLGQLKIKWLKQNTLTDNDARAIDLQTNDSITVKISGAHFTDNTLASNIGNTKIITAADGIVSLYVSNDEDAVLTIDNKYSLSRLCFEHNDKMILSKSVYFDIEDIRGCTNISWLYLSGTQISGDISIVSKYTNLINLRAANTQISGDISAVSNFINLNDLRIGNTQVSGDISAVSNLVNLIYLELYKTQVSGNISAVSNLVNLQNLSLDNTQVSGAISAVSNLVNIRTLRIGNTQVSGNISAVSNLVNLQNLSLDNTQVSGAVDNLVGLTKLVDLSGLKNLSLTGDMSKMPINVVFITQLGRKITTNFTWTANGRQNAKLLAMEGPVPFDTASMDNMLIDQAACTFNPVASMPWYSVIKVSGIRTSASDAAVATLQSKGVTIIGVTKAS